MMRDMTIAALMGDTQNRGAGDMATALQISGRCIEWDIAMCRIYALRRALRRSAESSLTVPCGFIAKQRINRCVFSAKLAKKALVPSVQVNN